MKNLKLIISLFAVSWLVACVKPDTNSEAASSTSGEGVTVAAKEEGISSETETDGEPEYKLICRNVYVTGSHQKERRCVTRAQQIRDEEDTQAWRRETRARGNASDVQTGP